MTNASIELDIPKVFGAKPGMKQKFAVYVPNKKSEGEFLPAGAQQEWVEKFIHLLANIAGGASAMPPIKGAWLNGDHLVLEEPIVVYSFCNPILFAERAHELAKLAQEMGRVLEQGEVAIEVENRMFIIPIKAQEEGNGTDS